MVLRGTTLRPPQCAVTTTWRAGRLPVAKTDGRNNGTVLPHRAVRHPPYFPVCQSVCSHRGVRQRAAAIIAGGYFRVRRVGRGGVPHPRHGPTARPQRTQRTLHRPRSRAAQQTGRQSPPGSASTLPFLFLRAGDSWPGPAFRRGVPIGAARVLIAPAGGPERRAQGRVCARRAGGYREPGTGA